MIVLRKQKEFGLIFKNMPTKSEVEQKLAKKLGIDYKKTPKGWLQNKLGLLKKDKYED